MISKAKGNRKHSTTAITPVIWYSSNIRCYLIYIMVFAILWVVFIHKVPLFKHGLRTETKIWESKQFLSLICLALLLCSPKELELSNDAHKLLINYSASTVILECYQHKICISPYHMDKTINTLTAIKPFLLERIATPLAEQLNITLPTYICTSTSQ